MWFKNVWDILLSRKTWVGFLPTSGEFVDPLLPRLKTGVLHPVAESQAVSKEVKDKINLIYARDYSVLQDIQIIFRCFLSLDKNQEAA